jgi:hypothetical protein
MIAIVALVVAVGAAVGTYFFVRNNKNKVAKIEEFIEKVKEKM